MDVLLQYLVRCFCSFILVFLLFQVAICTVNGKEIGQEEKSQSFDTSKKSSKETRNTGGNETRQLQIESITNTTHSPLLDPSEKTTSNFTLSQDNISNNTGLPVHSTESTNLLKTTNALNSSTKSSVISSSSNSGTVGNGGFTSSTSYSTTLAPTTSVHRKSKPEETHVDDIVQDSGPTTDYVVPLVIAMLAVPLVGVLCALLYIKGRDFWERRHYGRIDFLWDSRSDSRMDFLIDGMYRE